MAETRRLIATGHVGMRKARRLIGFTRQGSGCALGQRISSSRPRVAGDNAAPSATPVPRSHARNSDPPRPCRCRSATTRGSELHVPATSVPETETLTGVSGDAAINVGPSRTTQYGGSTPFAGLRRAQSQCSRKRSAASLPSVRL